MLKIEGLKKYWIIICIPIMLCIVIAAAYRYASTVEEFQRGRAVTIITANDYPLEKEAKKLATLVRVNYEEYRANTKRWSFGYFAFIYLAALLSALAGVILKLECP